MVAGIVVFVDSQFVLVSPEKANCLVVLLLQNKTGGDGRIRYTIYLLHVRDIYTHEKQNPTITTLATTTTTARQDSPNQ